MKRIALVLSAMFLFGCGGGGGTTAGNNTGGGDNSGGVPLAKFTLNMVNGVSKTAALTTVGATSLPNATSVRVVARRFGSRTEEVLIYDAATDSFVSQVPPVFITLNDVEIYKKVMDVPYTSSITVNLPVADGYTIDVLTNIESAGKHTMLKFGTVTPVNIPATGTSSATVVLNDFSSFVTFAPAPDPVTSEENFQLTATISKPLGLSYKISVDTTNTLITDFTSKKAGSSGVPITFKAPTSFVDGNLYFQGLFTIDNRMLNSTEFASNWTRVYPNSTYGESVSCVLNKVVGTTIGGL